MKFKHAFNVFIDNFIVTYKVLLYRVIILIFSMCLYTAVILPFIHSISDTTPVIDLTEAVSEFGSAFVNLDFTALQNAWQSIGNAFDELLQLLRARVGSIVLTVVILILVYLIQRFLSGLSNYTAAALINDKMAMRADSSFIGTLIKNLGKASLYNAIYVPLSLVYDIIIFTVMTAIFIGLMNASAPLLLLIAMFSTCITFLFVIKMALTTDWLPALIYGKMTNRGAIMYSLNYKANNKNFLSVLSNYVVLVLVIFALNVAAVFLTFGAGLLLTMPASYVLLISFEFVNYCDNNEIKYFMDKNTVVKPEREAVMTRKQFFKGENND